MRLSACLLACLFLPALPAAAAQVPGLYEVREPVTSQDEGERARGMSHALQMLAVRLTGNPASSTDRRLQPLLASAQQMVQQYLYEEGQPLNLVVTFNAAQVNQALGGAGLVLWNPDRPQVLTWWLKTEADGRHLVADGDRAATLQAAAQAGGLPLLLPMGDLGEQMLDARALLATDPGVLRAASERYAVDVRLAVVEQDAAGQRKADWVLWLGDNAERGSVTAADSAAVSAAVMQAVAQKMSSRFVATGNAEPLNVEIQGVDLGRYAEVQRLLAPFSARLIEVQGTRLRYQLNASPEQLRAQLTVGRLREVADAAPAAPQPGQASQPAQVAPVATPPAAGPRTLRFSW